MKMPVRKWTLRLAQPVIVGMLAGGKLDRDEVIDTLVVQYLPPGSQCLPAEEVLDFWKSIDWDRSDPMLMEEFECCDLSGAVHQAQADARRRGDAWAEYIGLSLADGVDRSHSGRMAHLRLVCANEEG